MNLTKIINGDLTKSSISTLASDVVTQVKEGEISSLEAAVLSKVLEEAAQQIKAQITDDCLSDNHWEGNKAEFHGVKVERVNAASRWDFSGIEEIQRLSDQLKEEKEIAKQAYQIMESKSFREKSEIDYTRGIINEDTGEIMYPAKKIPGKETIKITIPK